MKNKKRSFALARLIIAAALALALVCATGFPFVKLLDGAQETTDAAALEKGDYVSVDVTYIMGFAGKEIADDTGKTLRYFAVAPVGNRFVVFAFRAASYEDALALRDATDAYLHGTADSMTVHLPVRGMVRDMDASVYSLLYRWFDNNCGWMTESGVIGEVDDYADYLCEYMVAVDEAGSVSLPLAVAATAAAALLVLYALLEAGFVLFGRYKTDEKPDKKAKKTVAEKKGKPAQAQPPEPKIEPCIMPEPPVRRPVPATELPAANAAEQEPSAAREPVVAPEEIPVMEPAPAAPIEEEHV